MGHLKAHRWLLFISAILYPIFGYVNAYVLPEPFETSATLTQRIFISFLILVYVGLSFVVPRIRQNFYYVIGFFIYLSSAHLIYIGYACGWELNHVIGVMMLLVLTSLVFQKSKHILYYYLFFDILSIFALGHSPKGDESTVSPIILEVIFPTVTVIMYIILDSRIKSQQHILDLNASLNDLNAQLEEKQLGLNDRNLQLMEINLEVEVQVAKYNALYNTAALGIFLLDIDSRITNVNKHFEEITTFTSPEAISKSLANFIYPDDIARVQQSWSQFISNSKPYDAEFRLVTHAGIKWFRSTISTIVFREQGEGYIGTLTYITESKRLEEINMRNVQLQMKQQMAEQSSQIKQQFFGNMRAELRTPLNSILGFAQLLSNSAGLSPKQKEYLFQLESNSNNLLGLIDNMLDFTSFVDDKFVLDPSNVNLVQYIEDKIQPISYLASEKGISFELDLDPSLAKSYYIDSYQLFKAINALAKNALHYTSEGGVIVSLKLLQRDHDSDHLYFEIKDTGNPISQKQYDLLTRKSNNVQLALFADDDYYESLSLKLSKLILGSMGAGLEVTKNIPMGNVYSFVIRLARDIGAAEGENASPSNQPTYNFLIVEDNEFNQIVLRDTLLEWNPNCTIDIAENGLKGVEKASVNHYNLIFMDIRMPIMDGHEATRKILRELPAPYNAVPIIAVTAHALLTEKEFCLSNGMSAYVTKPFEPEVLISEIEHLLQKSQNTPKPPQVPTLAPAKSNYKVVNTEVILTTTKGKKDRIEKMVKMYLDSTPQELTQLKDYLQAANYKSLSGLSHSFKPKFAFLGMQELSDLAKAIELGAKENPDAALLKQQVEELTNKANQSYIELNHFLTTL